MDYHNYNNNISPVAPKRRRRPPVSSPHPSSIMRFGHVACDPLLGGKDLIARWASKLFQLERLIDRQPHLAPKYASLAAIS